MADVTHYVRARTWIDDPGNVIPDDVKAQINASLAVSTAQREVEKALSRLAERLAQLAAELSRSLRALVHRDCYVEIAEGIFVNPRRVAMIEASGVQARVYVNDHLQATSAHSAASTAEMLSGVSVAGTEVEV